MCFSTIGHTTKTRELYLIHRNKHREAVKMRRQRKYGPNERMEKTPEKELNEMEISNLPDAEFKALVIRNSLGTSTA